MVIYVECNNLHKRSTLQRKNKTNKREKKRQGKERENKILYKIYFDLKLLLLDSVHAHLVCSQIKKNVKLCKVLVGKFCLPK